MNTTNAGQSLCWVVFEYEVDMFNTTLALVDSGRSTMEFQHPIPNAVLESMLLHLRILVDILLSRGHPDDIKLKDLMPSFRSPLIDELRNAYGSPGRARTPCWTLNKMLAHPSQLRTSSYNYSPLLNVMVPLIRPLLTQIAVAR
jgi:hypothetical protein